MPILTTKLYPPALPRDHVVRPRLHRVLARAVELTMTLVTAPAGFGKSTLVRGWLPEAGIPAAWLSLDSADSTIVRFLRYFISAVRTVEPTACPATWAGLGMRELSDPEPVFTLLLNELEEIPTPFLLVLDDFHLISDLHVHELMTMLVEHCPKCLHLVVVTRHDPPLPLHKLRVGGLLAEVRQVDLSFTSSEAIEFFERSAKISIDESVSLELISETHGWPAAFRLLALRLSQNRDVDGVLRALRADTRHLQDYLHIEILDNIEPWFRRGLLATCILDSFCAESCQAVAAEGINGQAFVSALEKTGLFFVALDDDHRWYRYHHLFQTMLQRTLNSRYKPAEIATLHQRAGQWHRDAGLTETAVRHFLLAGNPVMAADTINSHLPCIMEQENFSEVRQLISMIPREFVVKDPELLLAEAWMLIGLPKMFKRLEQVRDLLADSLESVEVNRRAHGGYQALNSLWHYSMNDGKQALAMTNEALELLGSENPSYRGFAFIIQTISLQMLGRLTEAQQNLGAELASPLAQKSPTYKARILVSDCFSSWIDADMNRLKRVGEDYLDLGSKHGLTETTDHANYFLGIAAFSKNDLTDARLKLEAVVHAPIISNGHNYTHATFALALTYQAIGKLEMATAVLASLYHYAVRNEAADLLVIIEAFRAELALHDGQIDQAFRWVETAPTEPSLVKYRFYLPELTLARVCLERTDSQENLQAGPVLDKLQKACEETFNRRLLLETLVLQGLRYQLADDETTSLEVLSRAISLAAPSEVLRPFIDVGPRVVGLLSLLKPASEVEQNFLLKVLAVCQRSAAYPSKEILGRVPAATVPRFVPDTLGAADFIEILTSREGEILVLLASRLSNREIAERLFISPATVKRHSINLYAKLDVHNRHDAVSKATSLGLLSHS